MPQDRAHRPGSRPPFSADFGNEGPNSSIPPPEIPKPEGTYFLGRYRVVDEIGIGGMASVHLGRMDGPGGFQKWVAIKRIHPHLVEDESFIQMFLDEARIAARISHPNVASVFELGKHEDTYWIAMEYLHGEPLREVMRRTEELGAPMPPEIACRVIADAAEGLNAAHDLLGKNGEKLNLIHRDVTPHNLFVTYDGTTKVVDFGIAKFTSRIASTRAGTLKGKLAYMSPEQVQGEPIDRRTDIFALGVVLWELTTGQRLFRMESDLDTLAKVQECNIPRPTTLVRGYPIDLEKIVMKALAKNRGERFRSAREFSRALQSLLMRRGLFIASDEVSGYMQSIFQERIAKREAHLRWAGDVTQTINVDGMIGPTPGLSSPRDASIRSYNSDVPARPETVARPGGGPYPSTSFPGVPAIQGRGSNYRSDPVDRLAETRGSVPAAHPADDEPPTQQALPDHRSAPQGVGGFNESLDTDDDDDLHEEGDDTVVTTTPLDAHDGPPVIGPPIGPRVGSSLGGPPPVRTTFAASVAPPPIPAAGRPPTLAPRALSQPPPRPTQAPGYGNVGRTLPIGTRSANSYPPPGTIPTPGPLPAKATPFAATSSTLTKGTGGPALPSARQSFPPGPMAAGPAEGFNPYAFPPLPVATSAPAPDLAPVRYPMPTQPALFVSSSPEQATRTAQALRRRPPMWAVAVASGLAALVIAGLAFVVLTHFWAPPTARNVPRAGVTPFAAPSAMAPAGPAGVAGVAGVTAGPFSSARAGFLAALTATEPSAMAVPPPLPTRSDAPAPPTASQATASPTLNPPAAAADPPTSPAPAAAPVTTSAPAPLATSAPTYASPSPISQSSHPRRIDTQAASSAQSLLTVVCLPGCDQVIDNGRSLGASPIFKRSVAVGAHRLRLVNGGVTKVVSVSVVADQTTVVREATAP